MKEIRDSAAPPPGPLSVPFPSLMIKPVSSACQLRCRYCYYAGESGRSGPPRPMGDRVLRAALPGYLALARRGVVAWQGGEPLLAGRAHFERAADLVWRALPSGHAVQLSLQTNGLLLDRAWCRFFRENRFLVGMSLDGPPSAHDLNRVRRDGKGTADSVLRAMDLLLENDVPFNLLTVVTEENAADPRGLYRFLRGLGADHLQFIPRYAAPGAPGGAVPALPPRFYRDFLIGILGAWEEEGSSSVHVQMVDQALLAYLGSWPDACVFQQACTPVTLEASGNLYPCDFFVGPGFLLGNVLETPLADLLQGDAFIRFVKATGARPDRCRECRWREVCNGGCAYQRFEPRGRFDDPHPCCEALAGFFDAAFATFRRMGLAPSPTAGPPPPAGEVRPSPPAEIGRN